jgi:hypothetical protein
MLAIVAFWSQQITGMSDGKTAAQDLVQNPPSEVTEDVRNGTSFTFKIHPGLLTYVFHLVGNHDWNTIDRIEVSKGTDTTIIQVLKDFEMEPPYRGAKYFQGEDINFDGYADIRLMRWWGATGNNAYHYWLFDPGKGRFVFNHELSDLTNPTPNYKTKRIRSHHVWGMAGNIYDDATHVFQNGRLVLIRAESQDLVKDKKYFLRIINQRRNGKMVIVSKKIIRVEGWQ